MKKLNKALALALSLALVFLLRATGETLAFYSVTGTATNVITSGGIHLKIHEHNGDNGMIFPTGGIQVRPGDKVPKRVAVENTCGQPFYLRIRLTPGVENADLPVDKVFFFVTNVGEWTLHDDGCYYFNRIVQPGEVTNSLFREVEIVREHVGKQYEGKTLTLTVTAEAVQSKNNPADYPWNAAGWPESGGAV